MSEPTLSIVIPCLNEAETLGRVINEAWEGIQNAGVSGEVVVADNGSTDGSQKIATQHGARLVSVPIRGYGAALHFGIKAARGVWVLFGDGDLSYDFKEARNFVAYIKSSDDSRDLILGSRLGGIIHPGAMPFLNRYLGTPVLNWTIRMLFGLPTTDCNSGMRLIRREFYDRLQMRAHGMEWASELLVKSKLQGAGYAEVPISLRKDGRSRAPHLRRWRDGWRHLKSIVLLSPNKMIFIPAAVMFALGFFCAIQREYPSFIALMVSGNVAVLLGLNVKLVLHSDGVRTSRLIELMIEFPTAEFLLGLGLLFALGGGIPAFLYGWDQGLIGALQLLFVTTGTFLVLTSFSWGSVITHAINRLPKEVKN